MEVLKALGKDMGILFSNIGMRKALPSMKIHQAWRILLHSNWGTTAKDNINKVKRQTVTWRKIQTAHNNNIWLNFLTYKNIYKLLRKVQSCGKGQVTETDTQKS